MFKTSVQFGFKFVETDLSIGTLINVAKTNVCHAAHAPFQAVLAQNAIIVSLRELAQRTRYSQNVECMLDSG